MIDNCVVKTTHHAAFTLKHTHTHRCSVPIHHPNIWMNSEANHDIF